MGKIEQWLTQFIIGHRICPFAGQPWEQGRVRIVKSDVEEEEDLNNQLLAELLHLVKNDRITTETTLLVTPNWGEDFDDFWSYCEWVNDELLEEAGLDGIIQVVGFHPDFRFAETEEDDAANFTNRSPYPLLHLLREVSVEEVALGHPNIESIPERNQAYLREMSKASLQQLADGEHE